MRLAALDWAIIAASIVATIVIGLAVSRRAGASSNEYFLSGRSMGWGLLGASIVATTFSTDTPNLVTNLTRVHGVAGNWSWWAFLLTTMSTTFFFGHLWRRTGVATDVEYYELRYSGKAAAFLRAFRSLYLGVVLNTLILGAVTLALIKFGSVLLGTSPLVTVTVGALATLAFTTMGGLRGVIITDCILFVMAMTGAVAAAYFAVNHPAVGGLERLFADARVSPLSDFLPDISDPTAWIGFFLVPLLVQWWSVWYPGAEPGGGGFAAQRMFAAKDEKNAVAAFAFFGFAHYALRPWPWIIVALASLIVFPDIASLQRAFPDIDPAIISDDFAYPAMLSLLPSGWMGIVAASLIAAYVSTAATCLNLGSSYVVYDIYARFINQNASEAAKVLTGRVATIALMVGACAVALMLKSAVQAFTLLLSIGAGTGLLYMVRWFWPRVNPWSEVAAMAFALSSSIVLQTPAFAAWPDWLRLAVGVATTSAGWILVTFLTPPTDRATLRRFYLKARPPGPGWDGVAKELGLEKAHAEDTGQIAPALAATVSGCGVVYGFLFFIGLCLRQEAPAALVAALITIVSAVFLRLNWRKLRLDHHG